MATVRTNLFGRTVIYTDADEVTQENVADVLETALETHDTNSTDIDYLYGYYKGDQAIASRTKDYNQNILNRICVNRAYEISNFKVGYLLSAPIQYINMSAEETNINDDQLARLTSWMDSRDKDQSDFDVALWQSICGTAYRMVLPNAEMSDEDNCPFNIYTLDPRYSFVVYSSKLGNKPLIGVTYVTLADDTVLYYVYTDKQYFEIMDGKISQTQSHILGRVPIIEYPLNTARIGDYEIVLSLLDATNNISSDIADSLDQFVQAILVMTGVDIQDSEKDTFLKTLKERGGLQLPEGGDAKYLTLVLDQQQTQTALDNLYDEILTVCGMPNRNMGGTSTSDTGYAVLLRNGYSQAEARAFNTERMFKKSERKFLDLAILIANNIGGTSLVPSNVGIRFPRRNYTNDSANVSNLLAMLSSDWITPEFAYEHASLTADPHRAYLLAKAWHDEQEAKDLNNLTAMDTENPETGEGDFS